MNENKGKLCLEEITEKLQNTIRKFNEIDIDKSLNELTDRDNKNKNITSFSLSQSNSRSPFLIQEENKTLDNDKLFQISKKDFPYIKYEYNSYSSNSKLQTHYNKLISKVSNLGDKVNKKFETLEILLEKIKDNCILKKNDLN